MLSSHRRNDGISCPLSSLPSAFPATPSTSAVVGGRTNAGASAVELVRRYIESLPRPVPFRVEIRSPSFWRAVWTEFVATLLLLVVGCGSEIRWRGPPCSEVDVQHSISVVERSDGDGGDLKGALGFGLAVAALFHSVVHISGCHLNPAVTVTLLVTRCISPLRAAVYVAVQCLGAVVGAGIIFGLTPTDVRFAGLSANVPHPSVHSTQAFGVEFLITLFVALTFVANMDAEQGESCFKGPALGISYVVGHLFGVYWIGPILGAVIGGITYEYIRNSTDGRYLKRPPTTTTSPQTSQRQPAHQQSAQQQQHPQRHQQAGLKREQSGLSSQETELTVTSNDLHLRV